MHKLSIALLLFAVTTANAKHLKPEREYQTAWCNQVSGVTEYRLPDRTRVDCLTDGYAIEFDFAPKWAESIGQALYYGIRTDRQAGVVLIMEKETDERYLQRLLPVAQQHGITVWTMGPHSEFKPDGVENGKPSQHIEQAPRHGGST